MTTFGAPAPTYMLIAKYSPSGPALWVSHIGGNGVDIVEGLDLVAGKGLFVSGDTTSTNFPVLASMITSPGGGQDLVMLRLEEDSGNVASSAVFGGSASDTAARLAANSAATEVLITGSTTSTDLVAHAGVPTLYATPGGGANDAFLISLDYSGSNVVMRYATYFGGNSFDQGNDVAIDAQGHAYMVGDTLSPSLPTPPSTVFNNLFASGSSNAGHWDAFIAGFSFQGGVLSADFTTFFGGGAAATGSTLPTDFGKGIDVNPTGSTLVIGGESESSDLVTTSGVLQPANAGGVDAFVASFSFQRSTGTGPHVLSLTWATYFGGAGADRGRAVVLDDAGRIFVGGETSSSNFPILNAAQSTYAGGVGTDAFVSKMAPNGASLYWSTYWGGAGDDEVADLDATGDGNRTAVVGVAKLNLNTGTSGFPVVNAEQPVFAPPVSDAFVFAMGEPDILVQPTTFNVRATVGTTIPLTVKISNQGAVTLTLNAILAGPVSPGSPFSVVGGIAAATPILPGGAITLTLNFSPAAPVSYDDILMIGSDDFDSTNIAVTLLGRGL